jgi:hypothetical protein
MCSQHQLIISSNYWQIKENFDDIILKISIIWNVSQVSENEWSYCYYKVPNNANTSSLFFKTVITQHNNVWLLIWESHFKQCYSLCIIILRILIKIAIFVCIVLWKLCFQSWECCVVFELFGTLQDVETRMCLLSVLFVSQSNVKEFLRKS